MTTITEHKAGEPLPADLYDPSAGLIPVFGVDAAVERRDDGTAKISRRSLDRSSALVTAMGPGTCCLKPGTEFDCRDDGVAFHSDGAVLLAAHVTILVPSRYPEITVSSHVYANESGFHYGYVPPPVAGPADFPASIDAQSLGRVFLSLLAALVVLCVALLCAVRW